MSPCLFKVHLA